MTFLESLFADLRFALRSLRRAPTFTAVSLATLILGIAMFTSIFAYYNAAYNSTLPYRDANRVVALSERRPPEFGVSFSAVSPAAVGVIRRDAKSFERIAAYQYQSGIVMVGQEPNWIAMLAVDTAFVPLFDLHPQAGRLLSPEDIAGNADVVMISDVLWRSRFGGDPNIVGQTVAVSNRALRIVGVMPPGFRFPYQTDAIVPLVPPANPVTATTEHDVEVLAKLKPGVTRAQARNELAVVATRLSSIDARRYRDIGLLVRDEMLDRRAGQFLPLPGLFIGAGFFLLLIACTNVTTLFYARAAERRTEMAVRSSLGAGRARLLRQALSESLLLSAVAAAVGTWLSVLLVRLGLHFMPTTGFPSWFHVGIDGRVLAFAVSVMAFVTIVVGVAPALEGTRFNLVATLKGANAGVSSRTIARGSKRGLVVQLALSVALFIASTLLIRSFGRLAVIDFGYRADRIASVKILSSSRGFTNPEQQSAFVEPLLAQIIALPGATGVATRGWFSNLRSESRTAWTRTDYRMFGDGDTTRAVRGERATDLYVVSDGYFDLFNARVRSGRLFSSVDATGSEAVAVISARTAKLVWGDVNAVGHLIQLGATGTPLRVIGVVDNVRELRGGRHGFSIEPAPAIYLSNRQAITMYPEIFSTSRGDILAHRNAIVALARSVDPSLIFNRETTVASHVEPAILVTRVFGGLIGALGITALALSIIGIYGVAAFGITQRRREIGIRLALGGTITRVVRLIMTETLRFVGAGVVLGLGLSVALGRFVRVFLYDVSATDPFTFVVVSIGFGTIALLASYLPARRVARVDPLIAIRAE